MMVVNLHELSFGAPAAEREIDKGLVEYFVESEAYRRIASGEKTVLLGNRGAGKSAIFKVLASRERSRGAVVLELSPEDYSYEILSESLRKESEGSWAKQGAFASAWKYLIYVMIMKEVVRQGSASRTRAAKRIQNYLRDNHRGFQNNPFDLFLSHLKRIEGIKIGPYEASLRTRELTRLYKLEEIQELLPELREVCERQRVLVFVDELDRGWDASEDAQAFVAGLFHACVSINQLSPNLRTYVSLRRELYDSIPALYEDAQKYRDTIELIEWDEPQLLSLVANRIRYSVPAARDLSDDECWNLVFAETLQYRRNKSFNYIVDRTLYRPREIIQFCSACLEEARGSNVVPIDYPVISKAELGYSEERIKDIAAEYRFQFPGLDSVFEVFRGRTYTMERDDLEELCLRMALGDFGLDKQPVWWVRDQEPEMVVDILWKVGFLRAHAVGGLKARRRSGSSYLGPYQVSTLNLRGIHRFQVHPMFRSFLGMKEPKGD